MNFPRILKKRKGYIDRIKPFMQKSVAKVLTGQRRVGKSFLLYQLIEEILAEEPDANIIYVNLEDFTFSSLQTAEDLHSYIISHSKEKVKNYIFIDEIQDIPGLKKSSVRSYSMKIMIYTLQVVTPRCFQENSPLI